MDFDDEFQNPLILGVEKKDSDKYIEKSEVRDAMIEYCVFN